MPVPLAALHLLEVCEGLDYAHRRRTPTGKPAQPRPPRRVAAEHAHLLRRQVKVIDFGIAKAADRCHEDAGRLLKGKFGYMSPEQVAGMAIDRRSDLFAVGVLLYEMLTCQRLFVAETISRPRKSAPVRNPADARAQQCSAG